MQICLRSVMVLASERLQQRMDVLDVPVGLGSNHRPKNGPAIPETADAGVHGFVIAFQ